MHLMHNRQHFALLPALLSLLALLARPSDACMASGVCGPSCLPPPPAPTCAGGCGGGYSCGQYGCYRARARAASANTFMAAATMTEEDGRTMMDDDMPRRGRQQQQQQQQQDQTPDQAFLACCQDRELPDGCLSKCSYRAYTRDTLQAMYFKLDACPMAAATDIHFCAAQGADHRACCERNGVATTLAGPKCLTFCDQRPGNVTHLDMTYLACFDRFENMKGCFWHDAQQRLVREHQQRRRQQQQQQLETSRSRAMEPLRLH